MRKNFGTKTWLFPMPVLIVAAYDEAGVPNVMNAAWGGSIPMIRLESVSQRGTRPQRISFRPRLSRSV